MAEPIPPFDVERLCAALSPDAPCGPDLGYDPRFLALEQDGAGTPERQYGDKVYPAEPPAWPSLYERALELASETRDLRVAMWLARSAAHVHGLAGVAAGLQLLAGLLGQQWEQVHPQLDPADGNDPIMRVNALAALAVREAYPADLRGTALAPVRQAMRLRDLELGLGHEEPIGDEVRPSADGVMQGLAGLLAAHPEIAAQSAAALAAVRAIASTLNDKVGALHAADPTAVTKLLTALAGAVGRLAPDAGAGEGASATAGVAVAAAGAVSGGLAPVRAVGEITSRADASAALERVCQWFEKHEPAHPAPLLLRRAQRLLDKSFLDIMRDIAPDGLGQVENLAGPQS
jgi:type VI secretion system protein ImpA